MFGGTPARNVRGDRCAYIPRAAFGAGLRCQAGEFCQGQRCVVRGGSHAADDRAGRRISRRLGLRSARPGRPREFCGIDAGRGRRQAQLEGVPHRARRQGDPAFGGHRSRLDGREPRHSQHQRQGGDAPARYGARASALRCRCRRARACADAAESQSGGRRPRAGRRAELPPRVFRRRILTPIRPTATDRA